MTTDEDVNPQRLFLSINEDRVDIRFIDLSGSSVHLSYTCDAALRAAERIEQGRALSVPGLVVTDHVREHMPRLLALAVDRIRGARPPATKEEMDADAVGASLDFFWQQRDSGYRGRK